MSDGTGTSDSQPTSSTLQSDELVVTRVDAGVAELWLNNPPLNLVTLPLLRCLDAAVRRLTADNDVRAVVVHGGAARAFCAGSDMTEFEELCRTGTSEKKILLETQVLRRLAHCPVPTIAALGGPALGGGLELAMACDLRILSETATVGLPEVRVGGLASNGAQRLVHLIGPARAKEMLFLGDPIEPSRALEWGLANAVVESGRVVEAALQIGRRLAEMAPMSVRMAKRLVDSATETALDHGLALGVDAQEQIFESADLLEGAAAFLAKRKPVFTGE